MASSEVAPSTGGQDPASKTLAGAAPALPKVELRYKDLSYTIKLTQAQVRRDIPTVLGMVANVVTAPIRIPYTIATKGRLRPPPTDFVVLDKVSGVIRPGTLTLLLSPPGHGKSAYLKALSQLLPKGALKGDITYSGVAPQDAGHAGVHLGQLVQYVNQLDEHLPYMTVRETFEFIHANAAVDPAAHGHPALADAHARGVQDILDLLHLNNCQNTVVGDDLMRGISGGEKKRVTVGEGLLTNGRFLALDEISTGLDSAVTYDIVRSLKLRAQANGLAVVIALLQPTPEVYGLFDEVIMLREGAVAYHGPREALPGYLRGLGFLPPAPPGSDAGKGHIADTADWLTELLTNPEKTHARDEAAAPPGATGAAPPLTTAELADAWRASPLFAAQMASPPSAPQLHLEGEYAKAQYGHSNPHSTGHHLRLLVGRQLLMMRRNPLYWRSRLSTALVMAVVLGGLYYQRPVSEGLTYYGLFLNSMMMMGFANLSEMASATAGKYIAYRHVGNGAYSAVQYVTAGAVAHLPVALVETLVFCGILFGMSGMSTGAEHFFPYWLTVFLVDCFMRNLMAYFSYAGRTLAAAQAAPMPAIAIFIIFAGFMVTKNKMGWLTFVNYIDPFGYGMKALANNEFSAARYDVRPGGPGTKRLGDLYLEAFDLDKGPAWLWGSIGFLAAATLLAMLCSLRGFTAVRFDRNIGSARDTAKPLVAQVTSPTASAAGASPAASAASAPPTPAAGEAAVSYVNPMKPAEHAAAEAVAATDSDAATATAVAVAVLPAVAGLPQGVKALAATQSVLPFEPMTVVFKDIGYTVTLQKQLRQANGGATSKPLLRGISGVAAPGRMLALMGASGAGKTTLLDVLAGRKNSGVRTGAILLNGFPKEEASFNRVTSYVEQNDIHAPLATVREALEFSAALRLPSSVTPAQRAAFVEEVMDLLELREIEGRKIGAVGAQDGLAPGERKRLTIGVELVSNAPVIFLDEPTSGLDSRAAAGVIRVLANIRSTGRTIICTVHQPSSELFYQFDDLLLLQRGGWQVYFGPLGRHGHELVRYLQAVPGMPHYPHGMNVASWMLDALAGTDSSGTAGKDADGAPAAQRLVKLPSGEELQASLHASQAWAATEKAMDAWSVPAPGAAKVTFASHYARPFAVQVVELVKRNWTGYGRNIGLNFGRWIALTILNIMYGVIWYHIGDQATDVGGVQSLVASVFMAAAFPAMLCMNISTAPLLSFRAIYYREQSSAMYNPLAYNFSLVIVELPWLAAILLATVPIGYYMFGLKNTADAFGFHYVASFVLAAVYVSLGQTLAAAAPTFEVAQAVLGLLGPLFFLFGGLWSPPPAMAPGARWFCWIDPITYAFRALIPGQFWPAGGQNIMMIDPARGPVSVDRYWYVSTKYDLVYEDRWLNVGYLAIYILIFQVLHSLAVRYVRHIVR